MSKKSEIANQLADFIPENIAENIAELILEKAVLLTISNPRKTKKGDYRPPILSENHKISINGNLNKYEFLLTFLHEYAHLLNWDKNGRNVKPHGEEWKYFFAKLIIDFANKKAFPDELTPFLNNFIKNPASSTIAHEDLQKALERYNDLNEQSNLPKLSEIPINSLFETLDGKVFVKKEKRRKRYLCKRLDNNKNYAVSANIKVKILS